MQKVKLSDQDIVAMAGKLYTKIMTRSNIQALNMCWRPIPVRGVARTADLMSETEYIRGTHANICYSFRLRQLLGGNEDSAASRRLVVSACA